MAVVKLSEYENSNRRSPPLKESTRILGECRDLALHRMLMSMTSMLNRLSDLLFDQAEKSVRREETNTFLSARAIVDKQRSKIVEDFERLLRKYVDESIRGEGKKQDFSNLDTKLLKLVERQELEESVAIGNLARSLEMLCRDELMALNQRVGYLLGDQELESAKNPLSPSIVCQALKDAIDKIDADAEIKLAVLKQLNQELMGDINSIYADLNRHLIKLKILPQLRPVLRRSAGSNAATRPASTDSGIQQRSDMAATQESSTGQQDIFGLLHSLLNRTHSPTVSDTRFSHGFAIPQTTLIGTANEGAVSPITVGQEILRALTELQRGESQYVVSDGTVIDLSRTIDPSANVLRSIKTSALGETLVPADSSTIELVAMMFDYILQDRSLPAAIKALISRLQIPVLKAAMLDRAFFSKKAHPARALVNKLAEAGIGWSPTQGVGDPLYLKIQSIVQRVLDEFTDQIDLFTKLLNELEEYLVREEKSVEETIKVSTQEIERDDRKEIARVIASAEIETRIAQSSEQYGAVPEFVCTFLRMHWVSSVTDVYVREGQENPAWKNILTTTDELIWSVQPKRSPDDRRRLVKVLPDLLQRLYTNLQTIGWSGTDRETFFSQLVEAHATSVKAGLAPTPGQLMVAPSASSKANPINQEPLTPTTVMAQMIEERPIITDLERGRWVEFRTNDGNIICSKLAWVSPMRSRYLFTNRQGHKAFALSREELAERFEHGRARVVESEPLMDRALDNLLQSLQKQTA